MYKYLVSLRSWENPRLCRSGIKFEKGDRVIVVDKEFGGDLGFIEEVDVETKEEPLQEISGKATQRNIETAEENEEKSEYLLEVCHKEIKKLGLKMKLVDAWISLEKGNVVIAFTADGRVDFRELVRNLSGIFHRTVRMRQIGSRDEARKLGNCGVCGRELCCVKFSGDLPGISTEMARVQQVAHRGSERISGICGRLMCCLAYEAKQYQEMLSDMPELHSKIKIKEGEGEVIEVNAIKQEIRVKKKNGQILTIKKEELKR